MKITIDRAYQQINYVPGGNYILSHNLLNMFTSHYSIFQFFEQKGYMFGPFSIIHVNDIGLEFSNIYTLEYKDFTRPGRVWPIKLKL